MTKTTAILLAGTVLLASGAALAQPMGMGSGGGPMAMERLFERYDTSGDGRVTQADIDEVRAERHAAFDADGDGELTLEEYEALWLDAMRRHMVRSFQRLDVDGDGRVTVEEFQAPFARIVERLDTAEDGVVTRDDVRRHWQERREARSERRSMRDHGRPMRGMGPQ